jgi:outer membrane protein OmpA-like peptidoglycan-associated protein
MKSPLLAAVVVAFAAAWTGSASAQGAMGRWNFYRDYTFNIAGDEIRDVDVKKAAQVADYLKQNPSHRVALDGFSHRRVGAVREALIVAGVLPSRIETGAYGDPQLRSERGVAVLVGN